MYFLESKRFEVLDLLDESAGWTAGEITGDITISPSVAACADNGQQEMLLFTSNVSNGHNIVKFRCRDGYAKENVIGMIGTLRVYRRAQTKGNGFYAGKGIFYYLNLAVGYEDKTALYMYDVKSRSIKHFAYC